MTTHPTPQASSSQSRPPSLRTRLPRAIGSIRSASNRQTSTQISTIFAQPASAGPSSSMSGQTSEEALLKQLDGDGGRQMGLWSRKGSSATIRTMRTRRDSSTSLAITADPQSSEPIAGPSQPSPHSSSLPFTLLEEDDFGDSNQPSETISRRRTARQVNPKTSSSWLRWNSPAPSFPRSNPPSLSDKGKGKGRADEFSDGEQQRSPHSNPPRCSCAFG